MTLGYEGFLPACAEAAVEIPKFYGYDLEGKRAVVIGRSNVVGKPVAAAAHARALHGDRVPSAHA